MYFDTPGYINKSDDSYSVLFEFNNECGFDFDLIFHKKINCITTRVEESDVSFSVEKLNSYLGDDYEKYNNELSIRLYKQYYHSYYCDALGVSPKILDIKKIIKNFVKMVLNIRNCDSKNLLLLHNIRIESHRFLVQRALSVLSERNEN